jgi:hypothetical protein
MQEVQKLRSLCALRHLICPTPPTRVKPLPNVHTPLHQLGHASLYSHAWCRARGRNYRQVTDKTRQDKRRQEKTVDRQGKRQEAGARRLAKRLCHAYTRFCIMQSSKGRSKGNSGLRACVENGGERLKKGRCRCGEGRG